jgi:hypothetical protein
LNKSIKNLSGTREVKEPLLTSVPEPLEMKDVLEYMEKLKDFRGSNSASFNPSTESFGFAISGKHTSSRKPVASFGPQVSMNQFPGGALESCVRIVNKELGITWITNLSPFPARGSYERNGYINSYSSTVGTLPGIAALLEDPNEDVHIRTEYIQVKGAANPLAIKIYASPHIGYVIQRYNAATNTAEKIAVKSALFNGVKSLVTRNLDTGRELGARHVMQLLNYASSFEEFHDTLRGPGWSTGFSEVVNGHDNQCNMFAAEYAGWYDFSPFTNTSIPQGILGNPIPPAEKVKPRSGYVVKNPCKGYVTGWNTAMIQSLPSVYGDAEFNRGAWIERMIKDAISGGKKVSSETLREFLLNLGNNVGGAANPTTYTNQNFQGESFTFLFRKRFTEAVAKFPTPERQAAVDFLADYNGGWVEGDSYDLINSHDLSDKWMLARQWVWSVHTNIFKLTWGNAWSLFFSSNRNNTRGSAYCTRMMGLLSRVLGTSSVHNQLNYNGWLTGVGNIDELIAKSLDEAIAFLGGGLGGWGKNKRPNIPYSNSVFPDLKAFPGQNTPSANRISMYYITQMLSGHHVQNNMVGQTQSGLILLENGVPTAQDTAIFESWRLYNPVVETVIKGKKVQKCKKR